MSKSKIIFQAKQEVLGKHLRTKTWIEYTGNITVYDRKTHPVTLKIKSRKVDSFLYELLEEKKEFKGNAVTEVYAKLSKWMYLREIIFQN